MRIIKAPSPAHRGDDGGAQKNVDLGGRDDQDNKENLTSLQAATIGKLLDKAKRAIASGEASLHEAAEYIAKAEKQGATQRQIAEAVGKSAAWVNGLLRWRRDGYKDSPFGPQSKRARVQATKQKKKSRPATTEEQARAQTAKAEAQKAKAEAEKARAEARKARSESVKARSDARRMRDEFVSSLFGGRREKKKIHSGPRELLIKALGMLGSDHVGERANAALGLTWDELIVPAEDERSKAA
jgi:hypothetical protein